MKEETKTGKVVYRYRGFESIYDIERDLIWALEHELDFPPEYTDGYIKLTLEYVNEEE